MANHVTTIQILIATLLRNKRRGGVSGCGQLLTHSISLIKKSRCVNPWGRMNRPRIAFSHQKKEGSSLDVGTRKEHMLCVCIMRLGREGKNMFNDRERWLMVGVAIVQWSLHALTQKKGEQKIGKRRRVRGRNQGRRTNHKQETGLEPNTAPLWSWASTKEGLSAMSHSGRKRGSGERDGMSNQEGEGDGRTESQYCLCLNANAKCPNAIANTHRKWYMVYIGYGAWAHWLNQWNRKSNDQFWSDTDRVEYHQLYYMMK